MISNWWHGAYCDLRLPRYMGASVVVVPMLEPGLGVVGTTHDPWETVALQQAAGARLRASLGARALYVKTYRNIVTSYPIGTS